VRVGFTGTREGMSRDQARQLRWLLDALLDSHLADGEFHYGTHATVALLADGEAAQIAAELGVKALVPHHAFHGQELARNRRMVAQIDLLVAAPLTDAEEQRSGTWATVRYARERGIPVVMLSARKRD
jgi:hypothetical protein